MKKILFALGVASLSLSTQASDLSYSNVGLSYLNGDVGKWDADGFGFDASLAISNSFFVDGSYSRVDIDDFDAESDSYSLGLGFHAPITSTADIVLGVSWLHAEADACLYSTCASVDDNGWGTEAGIRWLVAPQFEANIFVGYADIGDDDDTSIRLGGRYFITQLFSIGAGYSSTNDADVDLWDINMHYHF